MKDMKPTLNEIARRISQKRKSLPLTQAELAEKLQKSRAYIISLENGEVQPTVTVMYELAEIFGCAVTELLPSKPLTEERPLMRGASVSADSEDLIAEMLKETKNGD